ncbi:hypothetical protein KKA14_00365 [bacterium]|nr:hypothetical protein [bacterium]
MKLEKGKFKTLLGYASFQLIMELKNEKDIFCFFGDIFTLFTCSGILLMEHQVAVWEHCFGQVAKLLSRTHQHTLPTEVHTPVFLV